MVEVHSVRVSCMVTSRFAHTVMTSKALNAANVSQEIFFEVELPKTAFITNFSMSVFLLHFHFHSGHIPACVMTICVRDNINPCFLPQLCSSSIILLISYLCGIVLFSIFVSHITGKLKVRSMLGRWRRKKKLRNNMRRLFPLDRQLDWSSESLNMKNNKSTCSEKLPHFDLIKILNW